MATMQAVGYTELGGVEVLKSVALPKPKAVGRDIVVEIKAASTNPVDCKLRQYNFGLPFAGGGQPNVDGYDGAGVVVECGSECELGFNVGDEVFFSGVFVRNGTFAEFTAVDERIVAKKPQSLNFADSAAFPLVTLTGWENLVESMRIDEADGPKTILVVAGAGGAGCFGIQLAKYYGCTVIATASRPESVDFCKAMGADFVIPHPKNEKGTGQVLKESIQALPGFEGAGAVVQGVYVCADDQSYCDQIVDVVAPVGFICPIVLFTPSRESLLKMYLGRVSLCFGLMFVRPLHNVKPEKQGQILKKVAQLIDEGKLKKITGEGLVYEGLGLETLQNALKKQESGGAMGKIVVDYKK